MRVVGLITEYNPFHNGHLHHLKESLSVTGADSAVAVMSGHFLQRGEPALVDKWLRTETALAAGVDLVLELPFPFACNSAPHFARGAIRSLDALGIVDALSFGSEAGDLPQLQRVADLLVDNEEAILTETAARLREGINYPVARTEVLSRLAPQLPAGVVAAPNNILGVEYLKALRTTGSKIVPYTITRLGPGYHSQKIFGDIASATGIRNLLDRQQDVSAYLPAACRELFAEAIEAGRSLDKQRLFVALQIILLQEPERLKGLYQLDHGLERRLAEAAMMAADYAGLVAAVKSRNWTQTRLQRVLSYVLLQVGDTEMNAYLEAGPLYLRLLGVSARGQACLAKVRKRKSLPLLSDPSRARATLRRFYRRQPERLTLAERMLAIDLRATRLYSMLLRTRPAKHANRDYFEAVRRL